ncbi:MAG: hypothetical protein ACP5XB_27670, partial [Isosphaeraceae bacterium]
SHSGRDFRDCEATDQAMSRNVTVSHGMIPQHNPKNGFGTAKDPRRHRVPSDNRNSAFRRRRNKANLHGFRTIAAVASRRIKPNKVAAGVAI